MTKIRVGVWQTLFVKIGLAEWLSKQTGVECAWTETKNPTEHLRNNPVDLLIAYRGIDELDQCMRAINRMPNPAHVAITASSWLNSEEVMHLTELGASSILKLPHNERGQLAFLEALRATAHGHTVYDREIVPPRLEINVPRPRTRIVESPLPSMPDFAKRYLLYA